MVAAVVVTIFSVLVVYYEMSTPLESVANMLVKTAEGLVSGGFCTFKILKARLCPEAMVPPTKVKEAVTVWPLLTQVTITRALTAVQEGTVGSVTVAGNVRVN